MTLCEPNGKTGSGVNEIIRDLWPVITRLRSQASFERQQGRKPRAAMTNDLADAVLKAIATMDEQGKTIEEDANAETCLLWCRRWIQLHQDSCGYEAKCTEALSELYDKLEKVLPKLAGSS